MAIVLRSWQPLYSVFVAAALGVAAWFASGDAPKARSPVLAALLWTAALCVLLAETRPTRPRSARISTATLLLAAIGLAGLAFRLFDLGRIPPILSGNEAGVGLSALEYARGERTNLFGVGWWSFPALHSFVQSWPLRIIGANAVGLRVSSALVGTLALMATYAFTGRVFGRVTGLLAAAFLALSGFHIHFSRLGLNNVWESLFTAALALSLALVWKSWKTSDMILAGLVLGLTQFFYVGGRIFVLLVPLWFLSAPSAEPRSRRVRLTAIGYVLATAAAVVMPLLLFYLRHPDEFLLPMRRVSLFWYWWNVQTLTYGDPWWWVVLDQIIRPPLGIILVGLTEFYSGPLLTPLAGGLFLLGLLRLARGRGDPNYLWVLYWLGAAVLVVALSANPPAAQRYAGATPAIAALVALGAIELVNGIGRKRALPRWLNSLLLAGLILYAGAWEIRHYFVTPSAAEAFGDFNAETASRVAESFAGESRPDGVFFLVAPGFGLADQEVVRFLQPGLIARDVGAATDNNLTITSPGVYGFVLLPERLGDLELIEGCFPGGTSRDVRGRGEELLFVRYDVNISRPTRCLASRGTAD